MPKWGVEKTFKEESNSQRDLMSLNMTVWEDEGNNLKVIGKTKLDKEVAAFVWTT